MRAILDTLLAIVMKPLEYLPTPGDIMRALPPSPIVRIGILVIAMSVVTGVGFFVAQRTILAADEALPPAGGTTDAVATPTLTPTPDAAIQAALDQIGKTPTPTPDTRFDDLAAQLQGLQASDARIDDILARLDMLGTPVPTPDARVAEVLAQLNALTTQLSAIEKRLPPPPPTPTPTPTPVPIVIASFTGTGSQTTATFRTSNSPWKLQWNATSNNVTSTFNVELIDNNSRPIRSFVSDAVIRAKSGSTMVYGQVGRFYLQVDGPLAAQGSWTVSIVE
ncbi:MAG: hypothetical protein FJ318_04860 [SAR202 cluster bacterium]|nr:hypothetical protein [SAR202 cluster bacterium]